MSMKTRKEILLLFVVTVVLFLNFACVPKDEPAQIPVLTTTDITNISGTTATSGGTIVSDGGAAITERGVCWSTKTNPTIADSKTSNGGGNGTFTSTVTEISTTTTYYVRAYATNSAGTGYGNMVATLITDKSGNVYTSIKIGTQTWLKENLRTTKYRTGEEISKDTTALAWSTATFGACCDYMNIPANGLKYGKLYNWAAINDSRNIAPVGWHVATDAEWSILIAYLDGEISAGGKLKEAGNANWKVNTGSTNSSGFTALPGHRRAPNGDFGLVDSGYWWTSTTNTSSSTSTVWYWSLNSDNNEVSRTYCSPGYGYSVRCVKD